jgi:hypothetical protein
MRTVISDGAQVNGFQTTAWPALDDHEIYLGADDRGREAA